MRLKPEEFRSARSYHSHPIFQLSFLVFIATLLAGATATHLLNREFELSWPWLALTAAVLAVGLPLLITAACVWTLRRCGYGAAASQSAV